MYGKRGRIGLMVPTGNSVMEPEFGKMSPEGVSVHANRVYLKDVTPQSLLAMESEVRGSARGLVDIRIGVLVFGCTSGSFIGGNGYDDKLIEQMQDATGVQATTTTTAVLRALRLLGVRRISMATPYIDEVNALEIAFLAGHGIEVVKSQGGGIAETADIQQCDPEVSLRRAREVDDERAEAVFISCTGFRTVENLARLEAELGKPVISANQCTFADCLRILGVDDVQPGFGSLFERTFETMRSSTPEQAAAALLKTQVP
ncbi:MAG: aspartate/glutamate racemase family protein [SAR324 cluster bacterium]|nr:aspartate/glutamate racemase family protein [SAR324 cluster bacterium]